MAWVLPEYVLVRELFGSCSLLFGKVYNNPEQVNNQVISR